jgi:hypothetical protein
MDQWQRASLQAFTLPVEFGRAAIPNTRIESKPSLVSKDEPRILMSIDVASECRLSSLAAVVEGGWVRH